jgi:hypothetical protein
MNIFYLDKNPIKAAEMSCDKHVVKMILESAQMLSTAHRVLDGEMVITKSVTGRKKTIYKHSNSNMDAVLYGAGWLNHPSCKWVLDSSYNYIWLYKHMIALGNEYTRRYGKIHKTIDKLGELLKSIPKNSPINKLGTDPIPAMPDECKIPGNVVESYRKYYIMKKRRFATWKAPSVIPEWFTQGILKEVN